MRESSLLVTRAELLVRVRWRRRARERTVDHRSMMVECVLERVQLHSIRHGGAHAFVAVEGGTGKGGAKQAKGGHESK